HRARISRRESGDELDSVVLTGLIRAKHGHDLALLKGEADIVHGHGCAVGLAQLVGFDHGHGQLLGEIRGMRRTSSVYARAPSPIRIRIRTALRFSPLPVSRCRKPLMES